MKSNDFKLDELFDKNRAINKPSKKFLKNPFFYYICGHKLLFIGGLTSLFFTNIFDSAAPYLVGKIIDQISLNDQNKLWNTIGLLVICSVFLAIFRYTWRVVWGRFHHSVANDLRSKVFSKFLELGPSFYQKQTTGDLMSLINNDVNSFRMGIGPGILVLSDALFLLMIVPPLMMTISISWTWKTLIIMPLVPPLIAKILKLIYVNFKNQQDRFGAMSGSVQEIISGVRLIKSYAQELNQTRLFNVFSKNYELACNQVSKVDALFSPIMETAVAVGIVVLLVVGSPEVISKTITVGAFFTFYQYIRKMAWPMTALGIAFNHIQQGRASFIRIANLLNQEIDTPHNGKSEVSDFEELKVNNLSFQYAKDDKLALSKVNFNLKKGEILGVVGKTGSGKSTLADLLCGLYNPPEKTIFYNDTALEEIQTDSLKSIVTQVPQQPFLFAKSVFENLKLPSDQISLAKIENIIKVVNLETEINELPQQYDTLLGEKGVNLSGGQKQRLTIARSLLSQSPLIIFDDTLSAVDTLTEDKILNQLLIEVKEKGRTAIIITHRISALRWTDRVLVLSDGQVEALDSVSELQKASPTFKEFYHQQLGGGMNIEH